jgi:serine/threonine-protein kinase
MATVYRALDTRLECDVAVKVIRRDAFSKEVLEHVLKRFEREAKTLAKLNHPNIVNIIDYGEFEGSPYLVMPFIPSATLKERLGQPVPYPQAASMLAPVARALAYAHSKGVLHRDVKPSNILITESGEPVLTDFGIAKILEIEAGQTLTGTGIGVGTPEYMPPEQGLGKLVDQRSDIYALGVVFYELLTGTKPYTADTPMAVIFKHISDPLPRLIEYIPDLPDEVERIIFKAMAKKPEERYADMVEFANKLEKLAQSPILPVKEKATAVEARIKPAVPVPLDETRDDYETGSSVPLPQKKKESFRLPGWLLWAGAGLLTVVLLAWYSTLFIKPSEVMDLISGNITIPIITKIPIANNTSAQEIGLTLVSEKDGMLQLYVPAGEFEMGSNIGINNGGLAHTIYLDSYWIDKFEVTKEQYQKCVNDGACTFVDKKQYLTGLKPIVDIDWYQSQTYCNWADRRLPSEAEWEKAARGPDKRIYPWGNEKQNCELVNYANCGLDSMDVGSIPSGASPYGAMDMSGNVYEWVNDWYGENYYKVSPSSNPQGPDTGTSKVFRGGVWLNVDDLRATFRNSSDPTMISDFIGFRCANSP